MGDTVIAALLLAIVGVLIAGVVLMGIGGKANAKYGNKLMVARVLAGIGAGYTGVIVYDGEEVAYDV